MAKHPGSTWIALLAILALSLCPAVAAQAPPLTKNRFEIRPAASDVKVDGHLDEEAWQQATLVPVVYEWFPGDNTAAPVRTECLVTFDQNHLYVGFRAFDPDPAQLRANLADRDTPFGDDTVGFLIDTFHDRRRAFEFRVNPLGVQMEATLNEFGAQSGRANFVRIDLDGTQDWSWDAIWDSAGRVTPEGYVVEMAIPLKQLRFAKTDDVQTWGFLATRHYPRSFAHQLRSSYVDRTLNCEVCQLDSLVGFQQITPGRNLELTPTVTASRREQLSPTETTDEDAEAGGTVRWGITPNITFSGAVNPDFSQVEADVAQLDVNERFALFFPEKRPFFLEGADFFETPVRVFFSRSIADPSLGLKLTGKQGANAFGVLFGSDRVTSLIFPGAFSSGFTSLDDDVETGIVRYRRDVGRSSNIGVLFTGREGDAYHNRVLSADGTIRLTPSDTLKFQWVRSDTEYPDEVAAANNQPEGAFDDTLWQLNYVHATRNWYGQLFARSAGADFRADAGFLPQVDHRQIIGRLRRDVWGKPESWYSRLGFELNGIVAETQDSVDVERSTNLQLTYEGPKQSEIQIGLRPNRESFGGLTLDNFRSDIFFAMRPTGNLEFEVLVRGGEVFDFVNIRPARFWRVAPKVAFKVGPRFAGSLQHNFEQFRITAGTFLTANLTQSTLYYHFNARTFVRAIFQYRQVERDLDLYDVPGFQRDVKDGLSQLLFSYKVNAQTVFFLGYSDNYLGDTQVDFDQTRRAFFMKIGYAWIR